jgi:phage-related protein
MREVEFYVTGSGRCPVQEFIDALPQEHAGKVLWVVNAVRRMEIVPTQYLKKLRGTGDLWEVRVQSAGDAFRLLGFFESGRLVILVSGFIKKTKEVPVREISVAQQRRRDHWERNPRNG